MEINFDLTRDFFEQNPPFKSEFKDYTSDEMWSVAILEHRDSPYYNFSRKEKTQIIIDTFPDVVVSEQLIDKFNAATLSKAQKFLKS